NDDLALTGLRRSQKPLELGAFGATAEKRHGRIVLLRNQGFPLGRCRAIRATLQSSTRKETQNEHPTARYKRQWGSEGHDRPETRGCRPPGCRRRAFKGVLRQPRLEAGRRLRV